MHVVVIGAGIVGAASAVELQRDGHAVTIVEPGPPGGEQAASYGNGCWLSPSSVLPVSGPGLWKKVPGWLADPLGPLAIRWTYLPKAARWLWRFLRAGSDWDRVRAIAPAMRALVVGCPERHLALAEEAGVGHLIKRGGLLYPYPTKADYEAESESWAIRREQGITWTELDANELHQREPALDRRYQFAVHVHEGGHCIDPGAYVAALVNLVLARGGTLIQARAEGLEIQDGQLRAVRTSDGPIACDRAVIAAGAWSKMLAAQAGDRVPLETERGYHALILGAETGPRTPMIPSDGKMSNVRTPQGLRIAGQVEIACLTRHSSGSVIVTANERFAIGPEPCEQLVDTTGAGDLYAAGFLHGYARGLDLAMCGRLGSLAAAEIIGHVGARPAIPLSTLR